MEEQNITRDDLESIPQGIIHYVDVLAVKESGSAVKILLGKRVNDYSVIVELISKSRQSLFPNAMFKIRRKII